MYTKTYEYLTTLLGGCLFAVPIFLLVVAAFYLVMAWPIMLIWNSVLVPTFAATVALPTIGYWQTVWLTVLCKLLFSPFNFNTNWK